MVKQEKWGKSEERLAEGDMVRGGKRGPEDMEGDGGG